MKDVLIEFLREKEAMAARKERYEEYVFCQSCSELRIGRFQEDRHLPDIARLACFERYRVTLTGLDACPDCLWAATIEHGGWMEEEPLLPAKQPVWGGVTAADVKAIQALIEEGGLQ